MITLLLCTNMVNASNFITLKLPRNVEMELPKQWHILNVDEENLIATAAESLLDLSHIDMGNTDGELKLISAMPMVKYTYASVSIASINPTLISPQEADKLSVQEIKEFFQMMLEGIKQNGSFRVIKNLGSYRETVSQLPAIGVKYIRTSTVQKDNVLTELLLVFAPKQTLRITLSYRVRDAVIWKPVIQKIKNSITVK